MVSNDRSLAINNSVNPARTPIVVCDCSKTTMDHNQLLSLLTCNDTLMECCKCFHPLATVQSFFPLFQLSNALSKYKTLRSELLFSSCLFGSLSYVSVAKYQICSFIHENSQRRLDQRLVIFLILSITTDPDWSTIKSYSKSTLQFSDSFRFSKLLNIQCV